MTYCRLLLTGIIVFCLLSLTGCTQKASDSNIIKVGTISGPETRLMEVAKEVAAKKNLKIEIIQFNDYILPNQALADGSIDANVFQHLPYLNETIQAKHYPLTSIGRTFIYPMGIYSSKIKYLSELKNNAIIAIPNDPSNEARALLLLQKAGLIHLKPKPILQLTVNDIDKNPRNFIIKELDAAQLPRMLPDVDIAVINTNYAMTAGLVPSRDALFLESKESPYANIIVVRTENKDDPRFKKLIEALHSKEVLLEAHKLFQAQAIPAWER